MLRNAVKETLQPPSESLPFGPLSTWDTSHITDMSHLFDGYPAFNEPIGHWITEKVTQMQAMFRDAEAFNQPIFKWNTARVADMSSMFERAKAFNQHIGTWNTASVSKVFKMFDGSAFNQPINQWSIGKVKDMSKMFKAAVYFNQPLGDWNTSSVTNMHKVFLHARRFNQPIESWNTARVTNMTSMFRNAIFFNQPLGAWNTADVTTMSNVFQEAITFNQPISQWDTSRVAWMRDMFHGARAFNATICDWNTARVISITRMFRGATAFNQPIGNWDTSQMESMSEAFSGAKSFNQPLCHWSTAHLSYMHGMFYKAIQFDQPIGIWNTASVTTMMDVFHLATRFNQPIGSWNTARVTQMRFMFSNATQFNQAIGSWNTTAVFDMTGMFKFAINFCRDLSPWAAQNWPLDWYLHRTSQWSTVWPACLGSTDMPTTSYKTSYKTVSATTGMTTTSMTSMTQAVVQGFFIVRVSNATQFVKEPNVSAVLKQAIANILVVHVSWVQGVVLSHVSDGQLPRLLRRLRGYDGISANSRVLSGSAPDLTMFVGSDIKIEFVVVIPTSGNATVTATAVLETFDATSLADATQAIDDVLKSGFLGQPYDAQVIQKVIINGAPGPAPAPEPPSEAEWWWIVVVISICTCCIASTLVLRWTYKMRIQSSYLQNPTQIIDCIEGWSVSELLSPPEAITCDIQRSLHRKMSGLLGTAGVNEHEIFLTYSYGQRDLDAENSGPGLFYAAAIGTSLAHHGLTCCATYSLHGPLHRRHDTLLDVLADNNSCIKFLVVVETYALYNSMQCLQDICAALSNNIAIWRLRLEDNIPAPHDWWPIKKLHTPTEQTEGKLQMSADAFAEMRELVVPQLSLISPLPPPPCTLATWPHFLDDFAADLKSRIFDSAASSSIITVSSSGGMCRSRDDDQHTKLKPIDAPARSRTRRARRNQSREPSSTGDELRGSKQPTVENRQSDQSDERPDERRRAFGAVRRLRRAYRVRSHRSKRSSAAPGVAVSSCRGSAPGEQEADTSKYNDGQPPPCSVHDQCDFQSHPVQNVRCSKLQPPKVAQEVISMSSMPATLVGLSLTFDDEEHASFEGVGHQTPASEQTPDSMQTHTDQSNVRKHAERRPRGANRLRTQKRSTKDGIETENVTLSEIPGQRQKCNIPKHRMQKVAARKTIMESVGTIGEASTLPATIGRPEGAEESQVNGGRESQLNSIEPAVLQKRVRGKQARRKKDTAHLLNG